MKKHYVYAHANKTHGVFYVGKGSGERIYKECNRSDNWKKIARPDGYAATILEMFDEEAEAFEGEKKWIAFYRELGQCAANVTDGGTGINVKKRWWGPAISKSMTGRLCKRGEESGNYKDFAPFEKVKELYLSGLSVTQIGKIFDVSNTTVWTRLKEGGVPIRGYMGQVQPITCTTNGVSYPSVAVAAKSLGLHHQNIRKVLKGLYTHTGGFHFQRTEQ